MFLPIHLRRNLRLIASLAVKQDITRLSVLKGTIGIVITTRFLGQSLRKGYSLRFSGTQRYLQERLWRCWHQSQHLPLQLRQKKPFSKGKCFDTLASLIPTSSDILLCSISIPVQISTDRKTSKCETFNRIRCHLLS